MAFVVVHNPTSVEIGSTSLTGVVAITVNHVKAEIHAAADADTVASVARYGTGSTRGTITFIDAVQAEIARDLAGTLAFTGKDVQGVADAVCTIATVACTGLQAAFGRDAPANCTVGFISEAAMAVA